MTSEPATARTYEETERYVGVSAPCVHCGVQAVLYVDGVCIHYSCWKATTSGATPDATDPPKPRLVNFAPEPVSGRTAIKAELTVTAATPSGLLNLVGILDQLNYGPGEFFQMCTKLPGGHFRSDVIEFDTAELAHRVMPQDRDVWISINPTAGPARSDSGRGGAADVTRLAGLPVDLDVKPGCCPDLGTAAAIEEDLAAVAGPAGYVTLSGHGTQPVWPIEDGIIGDGPGQLSRSDAQDLLHRWGRMVAYVAGTRGVKVDSVFDLPRILRCPGTVNWKYPAALASVLTVARGGASLTVERIREILDESDQRWLIEQQKVEVDSSPPAPVWTGTRSVTPYLRTVLDNTASELGAVPQGQWNKTLYNRAFKLGQFVAGAGLPESNARAALEAGCRANDGQPMDRRSEATINSGLKGGMSCPKAVPPLPPRASATPAPKQRRMDQAADSPRGTSNGEWSATTGRSTTQSDRPTDTPLNSPASNGDSDGMAPDGPPTAEEDSPDAPEAEPGDNKSDAAAAGGDETHDEKDEPAEEPTKPESTSVAERREKLAKQAARLRDIAAATGRTLWRIWDTPGFGDRLRAELGTGPTAGMFRLSGAGLTVIRAMGEDGYTPPKVQKIEHPDGTFTVLSNGTATQQHLTSTTALAGWLSERFVFVHETKEDGLKRFLPPIRPIKEVHARQDGLEAVLTIAGFVHTPVFRPDGSLLDQPGYDPETQLLYLPDGDMATPQDIEKRSQLLRRAGKNDAEAAAAELLKLVGGFPFKTKHDRANLMALLITPAIMPMLAEPAPIGGINAHNVGSGKTLLCSLVGDIYGGAVVYGPLPAEDEEVGKILGTTFLTTTAPVVTFDNCVGTLRSAQLARTVTKRQTYQRILGVNKAALIDNTRLFLVNGNNLLIGGDLPRRVVPVSIDLDQPDAYLRAASSFAYPDLLGFVGRHRGDIIGWILTVVKAWINAGRPAGTVRTADSFADWREITAGVLKYAGVPGEVLHTDATITAVSVDDEELDNFLEYASRRFGSRKAGQTQPAAWTLAELLTIPRNSESWWGKGESPAEYAARKNTLADLLENAGTTDDMLAAIPEAYKDWHGEIRRTGLGKWMRNRVGRWSSGRRLMQESRSTAQGVKQWHIESIPETSPEPPNPDRG